MTYYYDLDTLEELARELGFHPSRTSPDELRVPILEGVLAFQNLRPKEETLAGFVNADGLFYQHWHTSTPLLREDEAGYVELVELDVLLGLRNGDILVRELYLNGKLMDQGLVNSREKQSLQDMIQGEELRIWRVA
jgi:hypothetical protein